MPFISSFFSFGMFTFSTIPFGNGFSKTFFTKILDVDHAGDIVKAENFLAGKEE
jgi:hypothetical protein